MSVIDVDSFDVIVDSFTPSPDGSTFLYRVSVTVAALKFALERRFSDFHALHNALFSRGFGALPQPPAKTLTRPNDPEIAEQRQIKLNEYLRAVCARPDLRQSEPTTKFLALDLTELAPRPLELRSIAHTNDYPSFSVVDFSCNNDPTNMLYTASYSDTTALSRLGRAWNTVEPDNVGALSVYQIVPDCENGIAFGATFSRQSHKRVTVARMLHVGSTDLLLAGDCNGILSLYECKRATPTTADLVPLSVLEVHIKAPFNKLVQGGGNRYRFASVGGDHGLRLMLIDTADCQIKLVSSGRVKKPLYDDRENLTAICLLEGDVDYHSESVRTLAFQEAPLKPDHVRAIVGTNYGQLLLYDLSQHPPSCIGTVSLGGWLQHYENPQRFDNQRSTLEELQLSLQKGTCGPQPAMLHGNEISQIEICEDGGRHCLVVALNGYILLLNLAPFLSADAEHLLAQYEQQWLSPTSEDRSAHRAAPLVGQPHNGALVLKVIPCPTDKPASSSITALCWFAEQQLLFCSYIRGVCCWSLAGDLLQYLDMTRWGTVRKLEIVPVLVDGLMMPVLLCATSLGGMRALDISEATNWRIWEAGLERSELGSVELGGAVEPDWLLQEESAPCRTKTRDELRADIYRAFRPGQV